MSDNMEDIAKAQLEEARVRIDEDSNGSDDTTEAAGEEDRSQSNQNHQNHQKKRYAKSDDVRETPKALKVKADPADISAEDRKIAVKKLAGAISHALRAEAEVSVRSFGPACIGKAAKALSIARNYIGTTNLKLDCSPAFITMKAGENDLTGISFCCFSSEKDPDDKSCDRDLSEVKSVLMVKADPPDTSHEDRKRNVKKLAGAITHSLEDNHEVVLRSFGNACISKASKAIAIARGYTATRGPDLYCWPEFIVADINGNERTGIAFYCYTNEL